MKRTTATSNKTTLISVDWDFFIPEKQNWDLGHRESLLYLKILWMHRLYLKNEMKVNGLLRGFWNQMEFEEHPYVFVSDSHAFVMRAINAIQTNHKIDRVVLFDAHHDCWKKEKEGEIYCHDWGTHFRETGGELVWVYPDDEQHADMSGWSVPPSLERVPFGSQIELGKIIGIHICRSGCWTPPWLDKRFISFVKRAREKAGVKPIVMQTGEWNPLKERFTKEDWSQAEALQKQIETF